MKQIVAATASAKSALVETLSLAFQDDPAFGWILPDAYDRYKRLSRLFSIMVPLDMAKGLALHSAQNEVATLWRAPGNAHDRPLDMITALLPLLGSFGFAIGRAMAVGRSIDAHHPKDFDYYYLHYAGVRPDHQGKGWGGAAIREGIARASAAGKSVYLETATQSNVGLYQRMGFVVRDEWDVPRGGPHFWSMLRQ